jgi:hypothetical protein
MKILKKIAGNLREEHERKREQSELLKPIDAGLTSADSRRPPRRCSGRRTVDSLHASLLPSAAALQPEQRRRLGRGSSTVLLLLYRRTVLVKISRQFNPTGLALHTEYLQVQAGNQCRLHVRPAGDVGRVERVYRRPPVPVL